jgi:protein phosphatase
VAAVDDCHSRLQHEQDEHAELTGMGTTLTAAYIIWPQLYVMHVGDSRCYLHRHGKLMRLTNDHTLGQQLVDDGSLALEDLPKSPYRNVLWNCIGADAKAVVTDIRHEHLQDGDTVLLCSDGLTDCVSEPQIQTALNEGKDAESIVRDLVDLANANGGPDNITVVVGRFSYLREYNPSDSTVELRCSAELI